jgi:hypothetical protein
MGTLSVVRIDNPLDSIPTTFLLFVDVPNQLDLVGVTARYRMVDRLWMNQTMRVRIHPCFLCQQDLPLTFSVIKVTHEVDQIGKVLFSY